jgi:tyrosine-specific transport protein
MAQHESKTLGAVFLIAGTAIGAGMLGLPIATGASGLAASATVLLFMFAYMIGTLFLFLEAMYYCPNPGTNLIGLCRKLSGPLTESFVWLLFLSLLYVAAASYMLGSGEIIATSFSAFQGKKILAACLFSLFFGGIAFFKMAWIDRLNRILIIGLIVAFTLLVTTSVPHIKVSHFSGGTPLLALTAIPVIVTSFTSHIILPSIRQYLDNNLPLLKKAIFLGCGIPLAFYLIWEVVILGLLPHSGDYSLLSILNSNQDGLSLLIEYLNHHYQVNYFAQLVASFSFFAIATSFWGVMISLRDFLEDGLNLEQFTYHKLYAILLAFIPPLVMVLISPSGFSVFLHYAGIIILFLYGVTPIYLVYRARYVLKLQSHYQLPGGCWSLLALACLTLLILGSTMLSVI